MTEKMRCENCANWERRNEYEMGYRIGLGKCNAVPMFYKATEFCDEEDDLGFDQRALKKEHANTKAFVLDGSGYIGDLLTLPIFGCLSFDPK